MIRHPSVPSLITTLVSVFAIVALAACGGDPPRELAGFVREPAPVVDEVALPDLSRGGAEFAMRADPGELLVVYFGFTNCPDICPTTLADLRAALRQVDDAEGARVSFAMVTVDPDRDAPVLVDYAQTFVDDAHALATDDPAVLRSAADPFGVSYVVETDADGRIEVGHTSQMFVVDDTGQLVLTWQYGIPAAEIAADLQQLLAERSA
ncbi:SCO family protein [soil metagenome]